MKRIFSICLYCILTFTSFSQETKSDTISIKKGIVASPKELTFTSVEIQASFPGGKDAWETYLKNNLNFGIVDQNHGPVGKYTVMVSYIVDKDGNITDVYTNDPGYGTAEEVMRVIKSSPKWNPGYQNGRNVKSWRTQNITFQVIDYTINKDTTDELFPPEYPNTIEAWKSYVTHTIKFNTAADNYAPIGQYDVIVKFSVDVNGKVVDVVAENDPGYGTAEEAVRVVKNSRKWIPATRNGVRIKAPVRLGIIFMVTEFNRRDKSIFNSLL